MIIILGSMIIRNHDVHFQTRSIVFLSVIAVFLIMNCVLSFSPYRSLSLVFYFLLLFILFLSFSPRFSSSYLLLVLPFLTFLACAVSLYGIYQHFFGFRQLARLIRAEPFPLSDIFLAKIESGRAFSTFMLPASLAGFLLMTIPLCAFLMILSRSRKSRMMYGILLLIQISALTVSFSLAALIALCASLAVVVLIRSRRKLLLSMLIVFLLLCCITFFLWYRGLEPTGLFDDESPLMLRFGNWKAAILMVRDHLLFGVGNGAYGIAFSQYREPWMNETNYAHNSFLQIVSENGLFSLFLLLSFLVLFFRKMATLCARNVEETKHISPRDDHEGYNSGVVSLHLAPFLSVSCLTFLFHNLLDFTFYQASISFLFFALCGIFFSTGAAQESDDLNPSAGDEDTKRGAHTLSYAIGRIASTVVLGWVLVFFLSSFIGGSCYERAIGFREDGEFERADTMLRKAELFNPFDSEYKIYRAQLLMDEQNPNKNLARAIIEARLAIRLDPKIPYYHKVLSDIHIKLREPVQAYLAISEAMSLYPEEKSYYEQLLAIKELSKGGR